MDRPFNDLATPLYDVTFCVVDVETTGGSPVDGAITEIGAVKLRAGRTEGTFATLVDPGSPIAAEVSALTGITDSMVATAPPMSSVLPAFLEFAAGSVLVGHNVRFDLAFLDAARSREDYPALPHHSVDTCALARRLLVGEVIDNKLGTLAYRLGLTSVPTHRALDDAMATGELLHALLERAARFGVLDLDDLLDFPSMARHARVGKLRLTATLPRAPGAFLVRDAGGRPVYAGATANLRSHLRSWFAGEGDRTANQVLRVMATIEHTETVDVAAAAEVQVRLVDEHRPRFNRPPRGRSRSTAPARTL